MTSIADGSVIIQTSAASVPAPPSWFGEVVLRAAHLRQHGVLTKISEQVRFARRRFGHYEVIDFLAILFGYAISGERTLETFYERLAPFAVPFMALFERDRLPSRSALSRFLAALTQVPVDALRTLFLADLESRPLSSDKQTGGLLDRAGQSWVVFEPIPRARRRVRWASPGKASSTNSSSRSCRSRPSAPLMSSNCICIAVPLNRRLLMRMPNSTPTAGALTPPGGRRPGKSSVNGSGTCVWNWDISFSLSRSARPNLLLLSHLLQPSQRTSPLPRAMLSRRWACPGKRVASRARTLLSSPMEHCVALPTRS